MTPDEQLIEAHLDGAPFLIGEAARKWRLVQRAFPIYVIAVSAATRGNSPTEFCLRFNCEGYNAKAPTATFWDVNAGKQLADALWPRGTDLVAEAFRLNYLSGSALYLPCDRITLAQHSPQWADKYPRYRWTSQKQISFYLEVVYELLNSAFYSGAALPAA